MQLDDARRHPNGDECHPVGTVLLWTIVFFPDVLLWLVGTAISFVIAIVH